MADRTKGVDFSAVDTTKRYVDWASGLPLTMQPPANTGAARPIAGGDTPLASVYRPEAFGAPASPPSMPWLRPPIATELPSRNMADTGYRGEYRNMGEAQPPTNYAGAPTKQYMDRYGKPIEGMGTYQYQGPPSTGRLAIRPGDTVYTNMNPSALSDEENLAIIEANRGGWGGSQLAAQGMERDRMRDMQFLREQARDRMVATWMGIMEKSGLARNGKLKPNLTGAGLREAYNVFQNLGTQDSADYRSIADMEANRYSADQRFGPDMIQANAAYQNSSANMLKNRYEPFEGYFRDKEGKMKKINRYFDLAQGMPSEIISEPVPKELTSGGGGRTATQEYLDQARAMGILGELEMSLGPEGVQRLKDSLPGAQSASPQRVAPSGGGRYTPEQIRMIRERLKTLE